MDKLHVHKPHTRDDDKWIVKFDTICGQTMYKSDVISEQEFNDLDREMSQNWKRYHNRSIVCGACSNILHHRGRKMVEASKKRAQAAEILTALALRNDPRLR